MKELLKECKADYEKKFASYLKIAKISHDIGDDETFKAMMKKAAGCKLMIEGYQRQLSKFK